jgi:hypothetical protein
VGAEWAHNAGASPGTTRVAANFAPALRAQSSSTGSQVEEAQPFESGLLIGPASRAGMWEESDTYLMALSKENVKANLLAGNSASMPSVSALTAKQARLSQLSVSAGGFARVRQRVVRTHAAGNTESVETSEGFTGITRV